MIPLALSIISSSLLLVIFKYFQRFKVHTFQAIAFNYLTASGLGFLLSPAQDGTTSLVDQPWFLSAMIIGTVFIIMFYLMAISSQKVGVAISSVANKMSLVIPVVMGVLLYGESLGGLRLFGVITAIVAVVMVTYPKRGVHIDRKYLYLPLIIFLGSGFLDTLFKYVQTHQMQPGQIEFFTSSLFLCAAVIGNVIILSRGIIKQEYPEFRSVIAGVVLGIPNYFSIHFLMNALDLPNLESTEVFPINNTGIVLLTTLLAIVLFKERLTALNWAGITLAVASIILIAIA